jgi:hypothetical protein
MYSDDSRLRTSLLDYIVDINGHPDEPGARIRAGLLTKALELAETSLERRSAVENLEHHLEPSKRFERYAYTLKAFRTQYFDAPSCFVLTDYWLTIEVLRNIFTNIRHAYADTPIAALPAALMELTIEEMTDGVAIKANYFGKMFPRDALPAMARSTTLGRHRSEIEQLGGTLDWGYPLDRSGSWIELRLLARANPYRKGAIEP